MNSKKIFVGLILIFCILTVLPMLIMLIQAADYNDSSLLKSLFEELKS